MQVSARMHGWLVGMPLGDETTFHNLGCSGTGFVVEHLGSAVVFVLLLCVAVCREQGTHQYWRWMDGAVV